MKKPILLAVLAMVFACKEKPKENASQEAEQEEMEAVQELEWTVLFDGSSFDGWHIYNGEAVGAPWKIEDGAMIFDPTLNESEGKHFNLVTDNEYTNFELSLEWMVSEGANSGVMWGVVEDEKYGEPYNTGPEIQVLDNIGHPDGKNGPTRQAGALYDMIPTDSTAVKSVGEWNHFVITINHKTNEGSVVLNDNTVAEFPVNGDAWNEMVSKSKFADWEAFGKFRTGKIALQHHGEPIVIGYRNIKIKEL
ncbi:DUF1080 domain-containing protein [Muricauda sp. CAU 1633]|uniref:3-keto-disaccharide hydrolase n=1 Tax=Allomuricauda sp. CAU 1633 TaxID=2816036 RepID=UPI001A9075D1|nr:DUF1080 domain-containing protein [Muricauda sp. CAU 1633]MBO0320802.1 DUF1080 domain-containing protein [Muricauda sp. CAU 1633]